jgi:hypothetical protein
VRNDYFPKRILPSGGLKQTIARLYTVFAAMTELIEINLQQREQIAKYVVLYHF